MNYKLAFGKRRMTLWKCQTPSEGGQGQILGTSKCEGVCAQTDQCVIIAWNLSVVFHITKVDLFLSGYVATVTYVEQPTCSAAGYVQDISSARTKGCLPTNQCPWKITSPLPQDHVNLWNHVYSLWQTHLVKCSNITKGPLIGPIKSSVKCVGFLQKDRCASTSACVWYYNKPAECSEELFFILSPKSIRPHWGCFWVSNN